MRISKCLFLLFLISIASSLSAQEISEQKSYVSFVVSALGFNKVNGTISGMKGAINFDKKELSASSFSVCIDPATIFSDNEKRDKHLKSEDYLHVDSFTEICFHSNSIRKEGDTYKTIGMLSMHGKSKELEMEFTYSNSKFTGQLEIDRYDFGIGSKGSFMMGRLVKLEVVCAVE